MPIANTTAGDDPVGDDLGFAVPLAEHARTLRQLAHHEMDPSTPKNQRHIAVILDVADGLDAHETRHETEESERDRRTEVAVTGPNGPCGERGEGHAVSACPVFGARVMPWEQRVRERLLELRERIQGEGCEDECIPWHAEHDALRALYPEVTL